MRHAITAVIVGIAVASLLGCAAPPAPGETATPTPTEAAAATPTPTPTPVVDPDLLLTITATATALDGATANLRLDVYRPVSPDSPDVAAYRAAMDAACAAEYSDDVYAPAGAAFIREELSVQSPDGSWSDTDRVGLAGADWTNPRPGGFIDPGYTDSSLRCQVGNTIVGTGTGMRYLLASQLLSLPSEPLSIEQSFSVEQYGFWVFPDESESDYVIAGTLGDCEITLTDAGAALLVESVEWADLVTSSRCVTGIRLDG